MKQFGEVWKLTCLVRDSPEPPQFIFWKHNEKVGKIDKRMRNGKQKKLTSVPRQFLTTPPVVELVRSQRKERQPLHSCSSSR